MKSFIAITCAVASLSGHLHAQNKEAEPFEDILREAVKQYRAGKINEAAAAIDQAKAMIDKQKSDQVGSTLPDAPEGWSTDEMKTEDVPGHLGGGKMVKKLYKNKTGQEEVLLEVFYGSTFIKLIRGLLASDDIARSQGFEIKRAGGEKVLVKKLGENNYELNVPMEDEIMIKFTGADGAKEDFMLGMLREIDRRELKSLVKP
jgi:hypothetical protein